jgi:predicted MFS family arabinose efflux permease
MVKTSAPAASARYQALLVGLLSLNFGILFFDRNALSFLTPFVKPDLGLSNTQVGLTTAALSFSWALATLFVGAIADRGGSRKKLLIGATIAFSLCSFLTGVATSFLALLGTRMLMGFAEGGVAPISQSITALAVPPERRGLAMGVMQNFGSNLLGSFAAPVALVAVASAWGWRSAFFLAGVPGLVSALLLWRFVREPAEATAHGPRVTEPLTSRLRQILRQRNMVLCAVISPLLVSYLVICWTFAPLFLTEVRGFSPGTMSWLMGTLGLSATVGSFVVSGISDRIGRKPVMIFMTYLGVILPLGALYYGGSTWILAVIFFFGWGLTGLFPLFMGTIPSESVSLKHMTTAIALVMGLGEVFGALAPPLAGLAADRAGLPAALWIMFGLCITAGTLALGLTETAPLRRAQLVEQPE